MKRMLYITQYYANSDQPGASRHHQHIQTLIKHGYQVTLITSYVKHRLRIIPPEYRGIKIAREQEGDLTIYKVYAYPNYGRDFRTRMLNYLSFMLYAIVAGVTKTSSYDVVFASSPSLFVGLAGYVLSRLKRVPFVFEIRDLWPETAIVMGALRNPILIKLAMWLAYFLYRRADRIIAVTRGIREGIIQAGIPASKIVLSPNGVDDDLFAALSPERAKQVRQAHNWGNKFVALYAGTLARSDGLEAIVRAAVTLTNYQDLLVVFLGDGEVKPNLEALAEQFNLSNVVFIPSQPKRRIPDFITAADVCLMPTKSDDFFHMHLPNKLYDYMAGARPVIAAVPPGEAQTMVEEAGAGLVIPPEDEISLAAALLELRDSLEARQQYGQNGRQFVMQHYLRSHLAVRIVKALDEILTYRDAERMAGSFYHYLKRGLDMLGAGLGLILTFPFFLVIGAFIRLDSPGPVFFRQERAGKNGLPFRIYKFRSMYVDPRPVRGFQTGDDPRITRVGHWLRRLSLDELPQLINIIKGEMSFIGPRPALIYQIERYNSRQQHRLDVRPGITGWAQVNGRNALSWEEKIELDLWYIDHCTVWLDLRILFKTVKTILNQSGVYFHGKGSAWHATPTKKGG